MNVRQRGFTLIEVLIVIGVTLLLVGIVVMSMSRVGDSARGRETQVALGNLKGMIAELEATSGLRNRQPPHQWTTPTNKVPPTDIWKDADPTDTNPPEPDPLLAPASVHPDVRFTTPAVRNTQMVMIVLAQAPKNRTAMSQLPSNAMVKVPNQPDAGTPFDESNEVGIPLDAWGNPILFVPSGGLSGDVAAGSDPATDQSMWVGGKKGDAAAKQVIPNPPANSTTQVGPIRSPDGLPFWASAGPDGDFRTGDDNVYSFES